MQICGNCGEHFVEGEEVWETEFGTFHAHECFTEFCWLEFHYNTFIKEVNNENQNI